MIISCNDCTSFAIFFKCWSILIVCLLLEVFVSLPLYQVYGLENRQTCPHSNAKFPRNVGQSRERGETEKKETSEESLVCKVLSSTLHSLYFFVLSLDRSMSRDACLTLRAHYPSDPQVPQTLTLIVVVNIFEAVQKSQFFLENFVFLKKTFFMNFFRCVNNSNDTFRIHEFILQCSKNVRKFFQVDQMSNCEMV